MTDKLNEAPCPKPRPSLARALVGGVGLLMAAGLLSRLFSLVSAPILTRIVGPSPYGVIALIGTFSSLATLALFGIDLAYARFFFTGTRKDGFHVEHFCWRFAIATGVTASLAAGVAWWFLVPPTSTHRSLALIAAASALAAVLTTMATTRQRILGNYLRIALATTTGAAFGILASILLARHWRPDAWAMLLGTLGGSLLSLALLRLPSPRLLLGTSSLPRAEKRAILALGGSSLATSALYWVIGSADRWMLGAWLGTAPVGIYAFASGIALSGLMVNNAITLVWFPEVSREYEEGREGAAENIARLWGRLAGLHLLTWTGVSALGGDVIRLLADPRFHSGAELVPWMAGGVLFYGLAGLANTGPFLRQNLKPTVGWWIVGAALNLALNALLIRSLGPMGAALASCLSFAAIAAGMTWSSQSTLPLPLPWVRLAVAALLSLALGLLAQPSWTGSLPLSILLKLLAGTGLAGILGLLLAPDWIRKLLFKGKP